MLRHFALSREEGRYIKAWKVIVVIATCILRGSNKLWAQYLLVPFIRKWASWKQSFGATSYMRTLSFIRLFFTLASLELQLTTAGSSVALYIYLFLFSFFVFTACVYPRFACNKALKINKSFWEPCTKVCCLVSTRSKNKNTMEINAVLIKCILKQNSPCRYW